MKLKDLIGKRVCVTRIRDGQHIRVYGLLEQISLTAVNVAFHDGQMTFGLNQVDVVRPSQDCWGRVYPDLTIIELK